MHFINAKQAYPLILGMVIALVGVGVWQRLTVEPMPTVPAEPPIVVPPLPSLLPRPTVIPGTQPGTLRVGNRTDHPVRLVVLVRSAGRNGSASEPLNWDFAPGEGGEEGLLLSLPADKVQLRAGDIIFAFATDGSRAYWGPNVVGQTDAPFWDKRRQEWSMILQP